nr:hypothetical protein [Tanacetum cinerariifolium]
MNDEVFQAKGYLMKSIHTFLEKFNRTPFGEMPKVLSQAWEKFFEIQHAQPEDTNELFQKLLEDLKIINEELAEYINSPSWNRLIFYNDDEEHSVQYKEYLANSSNFDIRQLSREECCIEVCEEQKENMEDTMLELLEVCQQKEFYCMHNNVDDLIKSALNSKILSINLRSQRLDKKKQKSKNIVEQPTKRGTHPDYSLSMGYEHLNTILETESDEVTESSVEKLIPIPMMTMSFEDIEFVEASLLDSELVSLEEEHDVFQKEKEFDLEDILQIQDVILHEKLLSINRLIADIEPLNDNPTPDCVLKSSASTFSDPTEATRSGSTTAHANNSHPKYDLFCFEIKSDQGRLTSVVMKDISDDSTNDPLLEEVNLFLTSDNSIPPGIENFGYDSEGDIHFLKELLVDDSIPILENESSNFEHQNDMSFPRPPLKPPDVEFFFVFEPNSEEVISDKLNEDECFDPGREIDVFANVEDDDYFFFIFVIRIFLPYLIYPEVSPLLLSTESEDTISLASPFRAGGISSGWNFHVI